MAADSDDLLLERPELVKRAGLPGRHGKKRYEAFDTRGKAFPYLEIRCVTQPSQAPQFKCFIAVLFSADFDTTFTLLYDFMAVEIHGRNLDAIRRAIQSGHCEFIQEFHDKDFLKPLPDEPVITSIGVIIDDALADLLSAYRKKKSE
jgi:hypothetical protein